MWLPRALHPPGSASARGQPGGGSLGPARGRQSLNTAQGCLGPPTHKKGQARHCTQMGSATHLLSRLSTESGRRAVWTRVPTAQPQGSPTGPAAVLCLLGTRQERRVSKAAGGNPGFGFLPVHAGDSGARGAPHVCQCQGHRPVPRAPVLSQAAVSVCHFEIKVTTGCHSGPAAATGLADGK